MLNSFQWVGRTRRFRPGLVVVLIGAVVLLVGCPEPRVTIQGEVADASGVPVADGDYTMVIRFYDQATGGTLLHEQTKVVSISDGLFNFDVTGFPPHIFSRSVLPAEGALYWEAEIEGQVLSPRRKMAGSPFAHALVAGSGVIGSRPDEANANDGGFGAALTVINTQPASSNPGFGIQAQAGNAGLYADNLAGDGSGNSSTNPEDNPDIILGGEYAIDAAGNTGVDTFGGPGVIASDPKLPDSDVHLRSNDEIWFYKDWDGNDSSEFRVYDNGTDDQQLVLNNTGDLGIDGVYSSGGADFAELIHVEGGNESGYEPGDVLVISDSQDRAVELADTANSTRVIGVYSKRPGVLGGAGTPEQQRARQESVAAELGIEKSKVRNAENRHAIQTADGMIEVAIAGIVPVKVTAENGPIARGDLLTTSFVPGHAMKAHNPQLGSVVGKAMGELADGRGTIEMLVLLQ